MATDKPSTKSQTPVKGAKTPPTGEVRPTNGLAIASLVVGIVAFISGWIIFWGFLVGITAVILGIIALKKHDLKGMSIAGIVLGGVGTLWSLIITVLFIIALVIGASSLSLGGLIEEAAKRGTSSLTSEQTTVDFKKGETATFGDFEVTVNSVQREYVAQDNLSQPAEGKEYIVVGITAKNISDESQAIGSYDFNVSDKSETVSSVFLSVDPAFESATLKPGESATGNIVFEIADGAEGLKLVYDTLIYDGQANELVKKTYTLEF